MVLAGWLPLAGAESEAATRAGFRGEVEKVGLLSAYRGSYVLVDPGPRFFLKVRIAGEPAAPLDWKAGETVVFALRSVIAIFGKEPGTGSAYAFAISVTRRDGRLRYADLTVESPPAN